MTKPDSSFIANYLISGLDDGVAASFQLIMIRSAWIHNGKSEVIIMGDFNEVQKQEERCGSLFNVYGVDAFNLFISYADLKEVPLGGCSFTWCHKTATKMSKHDRLNWNPMSYAKIKKTVWDYGIDKSPGADGFMFGYFRRYWNLIENNVTEVVFYFFKHGEFPKGAFVANRQILDGPFVLNELLHWCKKKKKKQSMIFKVDFEKAYDLVCWDILDDVLRKFGFGSKVGGIMSRIQSWNEIVDKLSTCLSMWKMKTLSIGDRLMLLKSVLVLAPKEKGGLGVLSFYVLNRALMFKWVWHFRTQNLSLWARVIQGIHGVDGGLGNNTKHHQTSIWFDIVRELETLNSKDIWRGDVAVKFLYHRLYALESCKNITVAVKLSHGNISHSFRRVPSGGLEQFQSQELLDNIEDVSLCESRDRWLWSLEGSGVFTVASVRRYIDERFLSEV
nr:hypothetical protein [Tanacetum cinerariifolium]